MEGRRRSRMIGPCMGRRNHVTGPRRNHTAHHWCRNLDPPGAGGRGGLPSNIYVVLTLSV